MLTKHTKCLVLILSSFIKRLQFRNRKFLFRLIHKFYFMVGMPKSLQIFLTKFSLISVWRGTAERLFNVGLCHHECFAPSRRSSQP